MVQNSLHPATMTVNKNLASTIKNYIASQGNGKRISENDVSIILGRMAEVNEARNKDNDPNNSIFKGGSKYIGGSGRTNFLVHQDQKIDFNTSEYNKIFDGYLMKMPTEEIKPAAAEINKAKIETSPKIEIKDNRTDAQKKEDAIKQFKNADKTKVKTREVNGQKQEIVEVKDKDGNITRRIINADGSLGDELIQKTQGNLFSKATFVTKTEMESQLKSIMGLKADAELPQNLSGEYKTDANGTTSLIPLLNGKPATAKQLSNIAQFAAANKADNSPVLSNHTDAAAAQPAATNTKPEWDEMKGPDET